MKSFILLLCLLGLTQNSFAQSRTNKERQESTEDVSTHTDTDRKFSLGGSFGYQTYT